jgi:hypothetical protein
LLSVVREGPADEEVQCAGGAHRGIGRGVWYLRHGCLSPARLRAGRVLLAVNVREPAAAGHADDDHARGRTPEGLLWKNPTW